MATRNFLGSSPMPAVAGGTIVQNRCVEFSAAPNVVTAADAIADVTIGVSLNGASSGEQLQLQTAGIAILTCSAAITAGAEVMVTASGAGKVSTAAGATALSIGKALTTTANDGEMVEVLLNIPNVKGAANS